MGILSRKYRSAPRPKTPPQKTRDRSASKKTGRAGVYYCSAIGVFSKRIREDEIALAKGKKQYDKRATIKKRDEERRIAGKLKK
jgi:tmRNA-binding protein